MPRAKTPAKSLPAKAARPAARKARPAPSEGSVLAVDKKADRVFRFVSNEKARSGGGAWTGRQFIDKPNVSFIMRIPKGTRLPTWADPVEIIPEAPKPIPVSRHKLLNIVDDETGEETELEAPGGMVEAEDDEELGEDEGADGHHGPNDSLDDPKAPVLDQ